MQALLLPSSTNDITRLLTDPHVTRQVSDASKWMCQWMAGASCCKKLRYPIRGSVTFTREIYLDYCITTEE